MYHFTKCTVSVSHFSLLKWETSTVISLSLWSQHPDINPVDYKICTEMQKKVYLKKVDNVNMMIADMALCNGSSIIQSMTDENDS